ncbi:MAG: energy-coupling factor ABC transporter ATP-binding protein, partial [Anaerolineales bacterium]
MTHHVVSPSRPIISFNDVHFAYPDPRGDGQGEWILQGVSFEVQRGQVVAVIGPTGSGKSTLALAMLGIVPQSTGGWIRGQIRICGLNPRQTPVAQMAQSVGLVFQDPESQFLTNSVAEEVAFGLESLGIPSETMPPIIERSLKMVGMDGLQDRSPYQLSGGQKQRVAIASI